MSDEAAITLTIKVEGGAASPWIVLRSNNPSEAQQQLDQIAASGVADALGRAHAAVNAGFNAGNVLGARTEAAPAPLYQPAQQAPVDPGWQQGPPPAFAQPQPAPVYQQQPAQAYAAAATQYQQPAATPGAPLVLGQPAKLVKGNKNGRDWQAWADPRPKEVTQGLPKTDNPNDPGLANGTASYWAFIR